MQQRTPLTGTPPRAAIFDGHGGDAAATWLHDNLQEYVSAAVSQAPDFESGFQAAFEAADDELLQHLESASEGGKALTGAGATGSVLLIDAEQIAVANVGDSSAILVRNGRQHTLTTAHRVYGECASRDPALFWHLHHATYPSL